MLRRVCALCLLALGVLWSPSALAGGTRNSDSTRCARLEGRTVLANDRVRIVRSSRYPDGVDVACHLRTGKRTSIARVPTQLVGSFVALFFPEACGAEECAGTGARLYDLRNGRFWRFNVTSAIRLLPGGKVVYVQADPRDVDSQTGVVREDALQHVRIFDRRRHRELASGVGINAATLAVADGVAFFMQAGQPHAAALK